ncbi:MAG: hypothetical protein LLG16_07545 [Euryarchaeota archaeon]|nr:hypothetical protein [Euryarchaeota archaeon]
MSALVAVLLLVSIAPFSAAEEAGAPTWEVGDQWAYGDKVYLEPAVSEMIDELEAILEESGQATLENIYINGSVEAYVFCHVAEVTADEYVLRIYVASGFEAVANIRAVAPVPEAGTYDVWEAIPMDNKTISVSADIEFMIFEDAMLTLDKDTFAIKSVTSTTDIDLDMSFSATNLYETELEGSTKVVTAMNYNIDVELSAAVNIAVSFDPYLDIFDFPIEEDEVWTVASMMTVTGNITGTFDANGLPEGTVEELVDPEVGNVQLPLDLSTFLGTLGGIEIDNGALTSVTEEISFDMRCNSIDEVHDDMFGDITVCELWIVEDDDEPGAIFYYSPDVSMFAYAELSSELADSEVLPDLGSISPIDFIPQENLKVSAMEPTEAAQGIYDVSGVVVSEGVVTDGDGDGDGGNTTTLIVIGAVAALAIIVVAAVLLKRK